MPIRSIVAALCLLASSAAAAQDSAAVEPAPRITLGIESGPVLVSTGAEFVQAQPGQVVEPGNRVLVSEGGSATLGYDGACQVALRQVGIYTVSSSCAGATRTGPRTGTIVGIAAGVAAIAAAAGGGGGGDRQPPRPPPVSR